MLKKISNIFKHILNHPLAGKHKAKTLYRFLNWQFTQSLSPKLIEYPFIGNSKIWAKKGLAAATANVYTGLHEFNEMGFLLHFLRKGDVFADIGANIGSYTILASSVIGAKTVAVEPILETYRYLLENIKLNKIESKVDALNIGLSSKPGELYFTQDSDSTNHVVLNSNDIKNPKLIKTCVDTLDNIAIKYGFPLLMKIDVEGYEQAVLNGGNKTLMRHTLKAIILELNGNGKKFGFDENQIHKQLITNNFNAYDYNPFKRTLQKLDRQGDNNTIYIRDLAFVESRIKSAASVTVLSETF